MKTRTTVLLAFSTLLLVPTTDRADDTDIIGTGLIQPNVVILLDSSGSMSDSIDGTPKITIAKQVVTDLLNNTTNVRFGVMKFKSNGAAMVSPIGTDTATMVSAVNGMSQTSVGTPLGDALYDVGQYYWDLYAGYSSPIDLECRQNMAIVVSDGLETSSSRDLRDEATERFTTDHSGLTGEQNVIVHTIGFGIDDDDELAANDFLQEAADNGGGQFFSTDSAADLTAALEALVESIVSGSFSFAGAIVPSTSTTGSDKAYQAAFQTDPARPFWRGQLSAFQRDADGKVPVDADGVPLSSALVWEAGQLLAAKAASTRSIHTVVAGVKQSFVTSNGTITPALLGVSTTSERDDIVDFIRGIDTFDEDGDSNTTEQREWKLGDILHSAPVLVTPPLLVSGDPDYQAFKVAQASRTTVLIVGANDGMLHAFRESDGDELWGFVPSDQLDRLGDLAAPVGTHVAYVDSSPVAADVKIAGNYRTVVVFGERRGGGSYHALDITDTTNPGYLWSFTDAKISESWSQPVIAKVQVTGGGVMDVAFIGGGYDTAQNNNSGKVVMAIDVATGNKIWEYYNDGSTNDRQYMNYSIPARPTALDLDGDGFIDRLYVGDVGGQLWKFDMTGEAVLVGGVVTNWTGKRLFVASPAQANPPPAGLWQPAQAIYGAPAAALDDSVDLWVLFGTGDLNNPMNTSQNRFYGVKDLTDMTNGSTLTESSLVDVTSANATGANGWYFRLASEEKVLKSADVFDDNVYFTTFTPAATLTCDGGAGPANLYAIELNTGYGSIDWSTGEELGSTSSSSVRSTQVGTGIPGNPLVVTTVSDGILDVSVVTSTSDEQVDDQDVPAVALRQILYWRERH